MNPVIKFKIRKLCLIVPLLFSTVGCDQIAKAVIRDSVRLTGPLSYFQDRIHLEYAQNPGAFLNLGAGLSPILRFWLFTIMVAVFLASLAAYLMLNQSRRAVNIIGLTLVLSGGLGNLIDRWSHGFVTDFLILSWGHWRTGIFNLADVAVTTGAVLLIAKFPKRDARLISSSLDRSAILN